MHLQSILLSALTEYTTFALCPFDCTLCLYCISTVFLFYLHFLMHVYSAAHMGSVNMSAFSLYTARSRCSAWHTRSVYCSSDEPVRVLLKPSTLTVYTAHLQCSCKCTYIVPARALYTGECTYIPRPGAQFTYSAYCIWTVNLCLHLQRSVLAQ